MSAAAGRIKRGALQVPAGWEPVTDHAPRLAATMLSYIDQVAACQRPTTAQACEQDLRDFALFVIGYDADLQGAADLARRHVEAYKTHLAGHRRSNGNPLAPATRRRRLGMLRMFFIRLTEWDWDDAPARVPIFLGDLPSKDEPLPKFLDDGRFAQLMRTVQADPDPLRRLVLELLARTGMRSSELCGLRADAMVQLGNTHWLRIPVGKLHNDRYIPLHPQLVELLGQWKATKGDNPHGLLLVDRAGRPLDRHGVHRMVVRVAKAAGIGHLHPHQLRHTLATQSVNRGMSLEAIAELLGHRSLDMTRRYARIANRTVAAEYEAVSAKVEALYNQPLPADTEGPNMRRLRLEHQRMLGNGYCNRPAAMDCSFESICESCVYYSTGLEFQPILLRQRQHAQDHQQPARAALFDRLLAGIDQPVDKRGRHR
jgi:site-specific recombinase XerD